MKVGLVAVPTVDVVDGVGARGREGKATHDDHAVVPTLRPVGSDAFRPCPPYAIYLLAGVLASRGHEVVIADLVADGHGRLAPHEVVDADLVGVTATSLSWAAARQAMAHVRAMRPEVPIVAGGVHASQFDRWVLEHSDADLVVRGDGEHPLLALCDALEHGHDLSSVPSLTWRRPDGAIVRNPAGPKISATDLTRWMPDYDQLPPRAYWGLALETARGCAFDCAFCSTPHRKRWRGGDAQAVADRLERLVPETRRAITRAVYLVDDEFTMNPARARAIGDELTRRDLPLGILYDSRAPDLLRPGLLDALAPHTRSLLVGAECGYDEGLERIGKGTTCDVLRRCAVAVAAAGIARLADFSFILGLPWEGSTEVRRTIDFAFELARDHGVRVLFNWYAQIPGSHLWAEARGRGAIHESRYDDLGVQRDPSVFFGTVRLTPDEIHEVADEVRRGSAALQGRAPKPEFSLPPAVTNPLAATGPPSLAVALPGRRR